MSSRILGSVATTTQEASPPWMVNGKRRMSRNARKIGMNSEVRWVTLRCTSEAPFSSSCTSVTWEKVRTSKAQVYASERGSRSSVTLVEGPTSSRLSTSTRTAGCLLENSAIHADSGRGTRSRQMLTGPVEAWEGPAPREAARRVPGTVMKSRRDGYGLLAAGPRGRGRPRVRTRSGVDLPRSVPVNRLG